MEVRDFLAGRPKLILRLRSGKSLKGYLKSQAMARGRLQVTTVEGQEINVDMEKLKAVFFVRDFQGNKSHFENKLLEDDPERPGLRVRVRFEDNETMEGVAENSLELLLGPGFFFWPADSSANNLLIYVVKSALLGFKVIGVKS